MKKLKKELFIDKKERYILLSQIKRVDNKKIYRFTKRFNNPKEFEKYLEQKNNKGIL